MTRIDELDEQLASVARWVFPVFVLRRLQLAPAPATPVRVQMLRHLRVEIPVVVFVEVGLHYVCLCFRSVSLVSRMIVCGRIPRFKSAEVAVVVVAVACGTDCFCERTCLRLGRVQRGY